MNHARPMAARLIKGAKKDWDITGITLSHNLSLDKTKSSQAIKEEIPDEIV